MPSHDPHSNRFLLLSIFVFASVLLYLTTHRPIPQPRITTPSTTTTTTKTKGPSSLVSASEPRLLVVDRESQDGGVIQHRILAIGDIHGDFPALTKILRKASLVDLKGQWTGGQTILVQTGDIVDRGIDTIACYRFMQTLRGQAEKVGGTVVSLLGNHEIMNALGDWRYVNPLDTKSFGGERNRREALSHGWIGQEWRTNYSITARVPFLTSQFPTLESVTEFPKTKRGESDKRFLSEPIGWNERDGDSRLDKDGAISFVHGGIIPEYLSTLSSSSTASKDTPITTINRIGHSLLELLVSSSNPFPISLPKDSTIEQRIFWSEKGPMWNRDWALKSEKEICERVERVCQELKVRRLVMGHTPHFEGIVSRCRGKVLLIDTGISRAYGGAHSFLDISHTLTPKTHYSSSELIDLDDTFNGGTGPGSYNEVLGVTDTSRDGEEEGEEWVEHEVIKAVYEQREDGTEGEETLVDFRRVVRVR